MQTIEQRRVPILEMAKGALAEEVNYQLGRVAENLLDPNTAWKTPRKLVVTMEFAIDEAREIARVTATTTTKLAPSKPVAAQLAFGADENGELYAVELSKVPVGQLGFDGAEEPESKVFVIGGRG